MEETQEAEWGQETKPPRAPHRSPLCTWPLGGNASMGAALAPLLCITGPGKGTTLGLQGKPAPIQRPFLRRVIDMNFTEASAVNQQDGAIAANSRQLPNQSCSFGWSCAGNQSLPCSRTFPGPEPQSKSPSGTVRPSPGRWLRHCHRNEGFV